MPIHMRHPHKSSVLSEQAHVPMVMVLAADSAPLRSARRLKRVPLDGHGDDAYTTSPARHIRAADASTGRQAYWRSGVCSPIQGVTCHLKLSS